MPRRKTASLSVVAAHNWDRSIKVGDLVTILKDIPHLYQVIDIQERTLAPHDFYNHPALASSRLEEGASVAPLVVIQRVREAPSYFLLPLGRTYRSKLDAYKLVKVSVEDVQSVIDNLNQIKSEILGKP